MGTSVGVAQAGGDAAACPRRRPPPPPHCYCWAPPTPPTPIAFSGGLQGPTTTRAALLAPAIRARLPAGGSAGRGATRVSTALAGIIRIEREARRALCIAHEGMRRWGGGEGEGEGPSWSSARGGAQWGTAAGGTTRGPQGTAAPGPWKGPPHPRGRRRTPRRAGGGLVCAPGEARARALAPHVVRSREISEMRAAAAAPQERARRD